MPESVSTFSEILELFLNSLEALAMVASIATFFYLMLNQYSKALKKILGPCGMGFVERTKALFLCRKSSVKKRAFIEFAMLKTEGYSYSRAEWKTIINEFKSFYNEGQSLTYTLPNCTTLIGEEFSDVVGRYFSFLNQEKAKKAFDLNDEITSWILHLRIIEAYATPTVLLTGLLSKYEQNWAEFIKKYVSTAYITESKDTVYNKVLSEELYLTFAWLLWGPSFELDYSDNWAGLCQLSFGDESNSIPAIAPIHDEVAEKLSQKFMENSANRYGALLTVDLSVFETKKYYKKRRNSIRPDLMYFHDKIENGDIPFALQIDSFIPSTGYKAQKYYCTAYVWILFELEDSKNYDFRPESSLAFFEHANLTDMDSYQFLVQMLLNKAMAHFERIFTDSRYNNRKYRFVCAMNKEIETALKNCFENRIAVNDTMATEFKERLLLKPKRRAADAFLGFDEYFSPTSKLSYYEISINDKNSIIDLGRFYTEIYMENFPDEDERETFDNLLHYLRCAETANDYTYHIIIAKDEKGSIIAGAIFDYFFRTNSGVIEFIAVKESLQSSGSGTQVYKHVLSVLENDAQKYNQSNYKYVFCEIDSPDYSKADIKKYLHFWDKHKYKHIGIHYIQPSLSGDQKAVSGLWLTVTSPTQVIKRIPADIVRDVIYDYFKYSMDITQPELCKEFQMINEELSIDSEIVVSDIFD